MQTFEDLPPAWVVWNDEPGGRSVLAFRPDVFDSAAFPAACLPTIYLTRGRRNRRRPGIDPRDVAGDAWHVTLYLEPEVRLPGERSFESREAAVDGAVDLARSFADGDLDYRGAYQVPRPEYLDRLDELTGEEGDRSGDDLED